MDIGNNRNFKILMCSRPGCDKGPGISYGHHVKSLNSDSKNRFKVDELWNIKVKDEKDLEEYDIFWFYAKGFDPKLYYYFKQKHPDKKLVFGQNVLLDFPDHGPHDEWDKWFVNNVEFDLYLDQVKFYNDHVKKFIRPHLKDKSTYLDKCIKFDISLEDINSKERENDVLVYSKKRRYDINFDVFRDGLIKKLKNSNIRFKEITYGDYSRYEYYNLLMRSKVCVNLSLDECPGMCNYESMYCNTPIIGSPHNIPSIHDKSFWCHNTDYMTDKYLVRSKNADEIYFKKIKDYLNGDIKTDISPREWVLYHTSYERYVKDAYNILCKYC